MFMIRLAAGCFLLSMAGLSKCSDLISKKTKSPGYVQPIYEEKKVVTLIDQLEIFNQRVAKDQVKVNLYLANHRDFVAEFSDFIKTLPDEGFCCLALEVLKNLDRLLAKYNGYTITEGTMHLFFDDQCKYAPVGGIYSWKATLRKLLYVALKYTLPKVNVFGYEGLKQRVRTDFSMKKKQKKKKKTDKQPSGSYLTRKNLAIALGALGLGTFLYYKFKENSVNSKEESQKKLVTSI